MSAEMINRVKELLDTYRDREWRISVLRHEMENPAEVSKTEQIEAMNFAHGDGLGHTKGRVSNKTLYIALNYEEQVERMNAETTEKIAEELFELERKQNRLEVYVALLEERQADIIRMMKISKMFILSMFTLVDCNDLAASLTTFTTCCSESTLWNTISFFFFT